MPWIKVAEPHAAPPRTANVKPGTGELSIDRGWAELVDGDYGPGDDLGLEGCTELSITDSIVRGIRLGGESPIEVEIRRSMIEGCDLSHARIRSIRGSTLVGCKLTGVDLSAGSLADVAFEGCMLRYANLRMAKLDRVSFNDCTLDDVDAFELSATDVGFSGSRLTAVNFDRLDAQRVDLREAAQIELSSANRLSGCLVAEHQLPTLLYTLAMVAGVDIEQEPDPDPD